LVFFIFVNFILPNRLKSFCRGGRWGLGDRYGDMRMIDTPSMGGVGHFVFWG
jgi:hypothetical protein